MGEDAVTQQEEREDILVVDDTPANLDLLLSLLSKRGYRIRPAPSGEIALRSAFAKQPNIILLDINMPGMDGYEVCERLKADERTADIPVIFLSAMDEVIDKVRAFEVGAVDYIGKPFHVDEVIARIETQLTLYQQRQEIETLREQERRNFEEMNRLKDQYVQMVSHDLKSPLSVVVGHASLLKRRGALTDPYDVEAVDSILAASERMRRLIRDLLDLARIESGAGIEREKISANDLLQACAFAFGYEAETKRITLDVSPLPDDLTIEVDHDRMVQVLNNLLSNAMKYTEEGGHVLLKADIEAVDVPETDMSELQGEVLQFSVEDNGYGIPQEELPHIFDRFYRVNNAKHQGESGTGLGLSITKAIVEQHGGHIQAKSLPGQGTQFFVHLPIPRQNMR